MKSLPILVVCLSILFFSCGAYKEFDNTLEHQKRVMEVRSQRYDDHGFVGKWQEYKRLQGKREIDISDTLKYDFYSDTIVHIYGPTGRITKSKCVRRKKSLFVDPGNNYKSFYMRDGKMTLSKGRTTHYLQKVEKFFLAPVKKVAPAIEGKIGELDALFFQGTWEIYKKTDPNFNRQKTYLQKMDIGESHADGTYDVKVLNNVSSKLINDAGSLSIEDKKITLSLAKQSQSYLIIEAHGDELVLEDGNVIYFLKKLSN